MRGGIKSRLLDGLDQAEAALVMVLYGLLAETETSILERYARLEAGNRLCRRAEVLAGIEPSKRVRYAVVELKLMLARDCDGWEGTRDVYGRRRPETVSKASAVNHDLAVNLSRLEQWLGHRRDG